MWKLEMENTEQLRTLAVTVATQYRVKYTQQVNKSSLYPQTSGDKHLLTIWTVFPSGFPVGGANSRRAYVS